MAGLELPQQHTGFPRVWEVVPGKCGLGPHSCSLKSRCDEFVSVLSALAVEVFDLSFPFPKWALQGIAFSFLKQFFFFFFNFIFRERGGREKERETPIGFFSHVPQPRDQFTTQARALTGNRTGNLSVCSTTRSHLSHTGHGGCLPLNNEVVRGLGY